MKAKTRVFISDTFDPWFNLATEEWIFRDIDPGVQTLFLWRNQNTVVIGRNQNPWSECNLTRMEKDAVKLARRTTGGGAVFHDLGNTCFTFLSPREGYLRSANISILLDALSGLGVQAEASGRNDLILPSSDGPRKFSGSAYREQRDRSFHHGTLLINADLGRLENYLTPHPKKMQSKGRASVRSRVCNLQEVSSACTHEVLSAAIIESFFKHYDSRCEVELLNHETLKSIESLRESVDRFSAWDWRFGHAPEFQIEMTEYLSFGFVQVFVDANKGHVDRVKVFTDALNTDWVSVFETAWHGKPYTRIGLSAALVEVRDHVEGFDVELDELALWLSGQIEA